MSSRSTPIAGALMTLATSGWASSLAVPAASGGADFDPIAFFNGRSHGDGQLKKLFSAPIAVTVDSVGRMDQGTLILDQTIREGNEPPRVRRWTIRRIANNRYTGTLTDAVGQVQVTVAGRGADIRYTMRHGFIVEQRLALQNDKRTVLNRLEVRKFGIQVATLSETIRRAGQVVPDAPNGPEPDTRD